MRCLISHASKEITKEMNKKKFREYCAAYTRQNILRSNHFWAKFTEMSMN